MFRYEYFSQSHVPSAWESSFKEINLNQSQVRDPRFYRRWERSGALGTIDGPVPSDRQILEHLSNENHRHMVETSRVMYAIQWLPDAVLAMDGISREEAQRQTIYWQIGLLHRVSNTESIHDLFPQEMVLAEINRLLDEIEMEGFRTADDFLWRCHPELHLGEVWVCNTDEGEWKSLDFGSKRRGKTPYNRWHEPEPEGHSFPVFVRKDEYVARVSPGATAR